MSVQTADYLDAVTHLPPGGRLTFYDVGWDEYEQLLAQLDDRAHLRISYNQGRLEITSPSAKHEKYKNLLHDLVMILSDELLAFPMLAAERLAEFVSDSEKRGPYQARRAFREWVRTSKPDML